MALNLVQKRAEERGEWGGPRGPEPTRYGEFIAYNLDYCYLIRSYGYCYDKVDLNIRMAAFQKHFNDASAC